MQRPAPRTAWIRTASGSPALVGDRQQRRRRALILQRRPAHARQTRASAVPRPTAASSRAGTARASSTRCNANATGHQRLRGCPLASSSAPPARRTTPSRTSAYRPRRTASTAASSDSPCRRRDAVERAGVDVRGHHGADGGGGGLVREHAQRLGGPALDQRIRIGQRRRQRRRRRRRRRSGRARTPPSAALRDRCRLRATSDSAGTASGRRTRPTASAARRRTRASPSVQQGEQVAAAAAQLPLVLELQDPAQLLFVAPVTGGVGLVPGATLGPHALGGKQREQARPARVRDCDSGHRHHVAHGRLVDRAPGRC